MAMNIQVMVFWVLITLHHNPDLGCLRTRCSEYMDLRGMKYQEGQEKQSEELHNVYSSQILR